MYVQLYLILKKAFYSNLIIQDHFVYLCVLFNFSFLSQTVCCQAVYKDVFGHFYIIRKFLLFVLLDDNIDPDLNYHLYANNEENCNYYTLDQYQNTLNHDGTLNIINYNIRSFNRNFDAFASAFLVNGAPDVLCLTETWFSSDNTIDLPGFHGFHITRDRRSRSVSLYTKNQYDATCVDELSYSNPTREVCTVDVKVNNFNGTFIAIYRCK